MFGYVRAYKPELTFAQYDIYKGVYCSLCKAIGKRYGIFARMILSFDMTFFALVRMAVSDECSPFKNSRCSFNPFKKCFFCKNNALNYSADVSILLAYYKILDNLEDSKGIKKLAARILKLLLNHSYKKAAARARDADGALKKMNADQRAAETKNASLDEAAHPSALALSELMDYGINDPAIRRFAYLTGRWVYTADAIDDLDDDIKHGNFNPLKGIEKEAYEKSLNMTQDEIIKLSDEIDFKRFKPIIDNIIIKGLYFSYKNIDNGGRLSESV